MKMINRSIGGYKYHTCTQCGKEDVIDEPIGKIEMPYCEDCGKIVLDAAQQYCCWCGVKFD